MKLTVMSSPHIRSAFRTDRIMLDVALALLPALLAGVLVHGSRALWVALLSVLGAVGAEWVFSRATGRDCTIKDGSALVTGLLLAMTLPASVPYWQVVIGDLFAIWVVKGLCGGLGENIFNPALAARAFLVLIYPAGVTMYPQLDGMSAATPLHQMVRPALPEQSLLQLFLGDCPGSIGEVSALALLAGGGYLLARKVISPRIPLTYLGTVALLSLLFYRTDLPGLWMAYNLLSGGLMLGAVFMATDYTTSPVTPAGQVLYGVGCGVLTLLFRYYGIFPEGVTYAILVMNACVWIIDRHTGLPRFGTKGEGCK